ncbi:MAG: class A beta-lactamase-related serine hydrolase [Ignavibacteria bacterium]|nr:class A beta-lactamase-related serine hydrolase [Ignavibacteria bacterium]
MKKIKIYLFCLLISITNVIISNAQVKETPKLKISDEIKKILAKYDFKNGPGISLAIMKDGETLYKKGFGIANLEYDIPITPKTSFHVASVSKQFTVFSILLLEQDGKLSIDDDIRKYLPEMPIYENKITIRNLANHTSGIRDESALNNLLGTSESDLITNEQVVKLILNQKSLNFKPNDEFEYCNSGYGLLAEIVKRVSGKSFAEFTKSRIFEPLKMKNSQFIDDAEIIVKNLAYSYHKTNNIYYKTIMNNSILGSTGLTTTTEDLSLWAMNFEKKTIGNDAIFNKMKQKGRLNNGEIIPYGLGLENQVYKGLDVVFHGGGIADYGSRILMIPKHNFSIVFMCNSHSFHPFDIVYKIVDLFLKDKQTKLPLTTINKSLLENYVGDYEIFPGYVFSFSKLNDALYQQVKGDDNKVTLIQTNDNEFVFPNFPHSKFVFEKTVGQNSTFLKWHLSDFSYKGKRIILKEFEKEKINLNEIVGMYYNSELNTNYNFVIKENALIATHGKNAETILIAFQPDFYVCNIGAIEIIRNEKNIVIGFNLLRQGIKSMKFEKINE